MRYLLFTLLLFGLPLSLGCDKPRVKFGGTVTYSDGAPLTLGAVNFDSGQYTFVGVINKEGHYAPNMGAEGAGIPEGTYRVWLTGTDLPNDIVNPDGTVIHKPPTPQVADKFCNIETSDLTFEAKPGGPKVFNIVVERPSK